jgi:signal transduction histidine kinase
MKPLRALISFSFLLLFLSLNQCSPSNQKVPTATSGVLDLREVDLNDPDSPLIKLDGEWDFYWKVFPEGESLKLPESKKNQMLVPGIWNGKKLSTANGTANEDELGGEGYATYRLKILLKEPYPFGIRIPNQSNAMKLFLDDQRIIQFGEPGTSFDESKPEYSNQYTKFSPTKSEITLTVVISNFHHAKGGIKNSIQLGQYEKLKKLEKLNIATDFFIIGCLLVLGIYHLLVYSLRRKDKSTLFFGIVCLFATLRTAVMGEYYFENNFLGITYDHRVKLEYIDLYLGMNIFMEYVSIVSYRPLPKILRFSFNSILIAMNILVVFTSPFVFTKTLILLHIIMPIFCIYYLYSLTMSVLSKKEGSVVVAVCFLIFTLSIINDIIFNLNLINTGYFASYGLVVFGFSQAYLLSFRFSKAYLQVQYLTQNLEKEVEERTSSLKQAQAELERKKSQIERLQEMSKEIQSSTSFENMLVAFEKILWDTYLIPGFFISTVVSKPDRITTHSISPSYREKAQSLQLKDVPIDSSEKVYSYTYNYKRSVFIPKLKEKTTIVSESDFNRNQLGMTSIYLIPLLADGSVFGVLNFSDIDPKFYKNSYYSRISNLSFKQREEIEQLVSLISSALFQSLQKSKIEQAYSELQEAQEALSRAERSASLNSMVSHLAHEVNNPLNYISTGEMITKETVQELKSFILGAIPESPESKPFVDKIKALFGEIDLGLMQTEKGRSRIQDTIQEIRAITGVDGIHVDNFDLVPLMYANWELTCEKNQVPKDLITFKVNGVTWPERFAEPMIILSQKYIFARAIRTLLNNSIYFSRKNKNPKIEIDFDILENLNRKMVTLDLRNNGPSLLEGSEEYLFDLKTSKYYGTELIGLPFVKEILRSVQCNIALTENGRNNEWVEYQVLMREYQ